MNYRFLLRAGVASALAALNEIPLSRELIGATDARNFKLGDGSTAFNSLPWLLSPWTTASGTDTITATYTDKPVLFDGMMVRLRAAAANTGAATFNPNSLGALSIKKQGGTALAANDIAAAGHELLLVYHSGGGGWWELVNPAQDGTGGGGGGGSTLVASATVAGSAATSLSVSGLDLSTDARYRVVCALKNNTASDGALRWYYNADTTATNYYVQASAAAGGTPSAGRANNAEAAYLYASSCTNVVGEIFNDLDGKPRALLESGEGAASACVLRQADHRWTSATNITGITIQAAVSNALAIGSYLKVYRD